ncbi:MAG: endonuclease/exonuclease/phosphatase family protein [Deltaproteobacteria bacterium]|nr:endonuclease/exonuclease/phosphatase family protein [Deltaproteobacteria bacterium]
MTAPLPLTRIRAIQGAGLRSPLAGRTVRTRGVVTGHARKGYFVQDPVGSPDPLVSDALFVYSPQRKARVGLHLELEGRVVDYVQGDNGRPTTQLKAFEAKLVPGDAPSIEPVWLTADFLPDNEEQLARVLNGLEGMLVGIPKGSTFVAPSNPFGDYVCAPPGLRGLRTEHGGIVIDPARPQRWLPGFRVLDYDRAPVVHVGSTLLTPVVGPLNYRSEAYQIVARGGVEVEDAPLVRSKASLTSDGSGITILTLNGFNLDVHVERAEAVKDPDRDIDDDRLYGRFDMLARAIARQAGAPDIVALQEIQDNDGAELTAVVDASETYKQLVKDVLRLGGPKYRWADIPPEVDGDGGQPGGNIRNGFLYNPKRVELRRKSMRRIGEDEPAFEGSRKPLLAHFDVLAHHRDIVVVNVHLASKRHQHSVFAPENPGFDAKEEKRVAQARLIREALNGVREADLDYYVTGDFNDFEFSPTLRALCGDDSVNMVETLHPAERYDYNHRGQLQVLMHGVVCKRAFDAGAVEYEILHGNELTGVDPGGMGGKASDHAYVLARMDLRWRSQGEADWPAETVKC